MKKLFSIFAVLTIMMVIAQSPGSGYELMSSNCRSINLGIVTITTGEMVYSKTNSVTGVTDVVHVPCSNGDRWHWFWE